MPTDVGPVEAFPAGAATPVEIDGRRIAVFNVSGELFALQDNCPHKNLPLSVLGDPKYPGDDEDCPTLGRVDAEERTIDCPWHNLEWDLETGKSPAIGACIPTYPVVVEDGRVLIDD